MTDGPLDPADVQRARDLTRRRLGAALADKATDQFCVSFARRTIAPGGAGLEGFALAATPETARAVIELSPSSAAPARPPALEALAAPALEVLQGALEQVAGDVSPSERAVSLLLRQAAIRSERDAFYRALGPLRDDIERVTASIPPTTGQRARIGIAAAPVQACWLNRTIRADTHASILGDVAAHDAIDRIDVPRRLEAEAIDVTIASAAAFRAQHGITGAGVTVGVIDTEVALGHPALQDRVVHRRNYTQEPFGTPAAHGTAVAGLIAGRSEAFNGMAPDALIYNYKVLATQSRLNGEDFEAALAIQHALEDGMRIVNCSWGAGPAGDGTSREARACDTAWRLGLAIVKSAGNRGPGAGTLTTPADAEGVLVVGASTTDGTAFPDYSSRGPTADGRVRPHVLAPGGDFGASIDGTLLGGGTGDLGEVGTSFAAPHVAGLLALLLQHEPELTPDQQRDRVVAACRVLAGAPANAQGAGLITPTGLIP